MSTETDQESRHPPDRVREWDQLYERCEQLGVVGIEFRRPSLEELEQLLAER